MSDKQQLLDEAKKLITELQDAFAHNFNVFERHIDGLTSASLKRIMKAMVVHPFADISFITDSREVDAIQVGVQLMETKNALMLNSMAQGELEKELTPVQDTEIKE